MMMGNKALYTGKYLNGGCIDYKTTTFNPTAGHITVPVYQWKAGR